LVIGIVIGLIVGIVVCAAFVFLGSEGTIDAPRISGVDAGKPAAGAPGKAPRVAAKPHPVPTIRVVGGAPPPSGPVRLHFRRGERVHLRLVTDAPVEIAISGYGIQKTLESGQILSFEATRAGQFPIVAAASEIALASLVVSR
jgi:hypothetical protein